MPVKTKARAAARKTEEGISKVGREIAKGGKVVEDEIKKGGGDLKKDSKKLRKKL